MSDERLILITGSSKTGKSTCLRNLDNRTMYLNTENGKELPFKNKFMSVKITDPKQVPIYIEKAEDNKDKCSTIVLDSITFMMDMFESIYVLPHAGTKKGMSAWGDYAQFFKKLLQKTVANSTRDIIMTAHTLTTLNEEFGFMETCVPIKGATKNNGVESYFTCVISTKRMPVSELVKYESDLLNITEEEELLGVKHVFQTKLTKRTVNERISSPIDMWKANETFIDNDIQLVLQRLKEYRED